MSKFFIKDKTRHYEGFESGTEESTKLLEISDWSVTILSLVSILLPLKDYMIIQIGYSFLTILLYWIIRSILKGTIKRHIKKRKDLRDSISIEKNKSRLKKLQVEMDKLNLNYMKDYNKMHSNMKAFNISMLSFAVLPYLFFIIMKLYIKFGNKKKN